MGFEPTTSTLARLRSTPELHPLGTIGALRRPCAKAAARKARPGYVPTVALIAPILPVFLLVAHIMK